MIWDNTQAFAEGWGLFDLDDTLSIEKLDESDRFKSDDDARNYVLWQALHGSRYHLEAMELHDTPLNDPQPSQHGGTTMIKSITIELEDKVRANVEKILAEQEDLRADNLTLRNNVCKMADNLAELRAENLTLRNTNRKMADKLTLFKNAETMNARLFQDWLDDRVTVIIK